MATSAEQLHHGKLALESVTGAGRRLYIDLDVCASGACDGCDVHCDYFHHVGNSGVRSIMELTAYALVCRRCEDPHCVSACPHDALEQQPDKGNVLVRHASRCVNCRSCSMACPYGTIYPDCVPLLTHNCDFCLGRLNADEEPLCVRTCSVGALRYVEADAANGDHTYRVGENLIVHSTHWERDEA